MPNFDTYNDPKRILTVHDRLELALGEREKNTLEEWQKNKSEALQANPVTGILSCPTEVLDCIFQHVSANHDLASLCRVNKRFFASALLLLYKTLRVTIKPLLDPAILRMLTRENTGLRYVRHIYASPGKVDSARLPLLHQSFSMLVNQLPQNQLRTFHWTGCDQLPAMIMTTLWQRQTQLRNIDILPEADLHLRNGVSEQRSYVQRLSFSKLQAVRAVLKGYTTVRIANIALKYGKVVALDVDALFWIGKDPHEHNAEPGDMNPDPGPVAVTNPDAPPDIIPDPEFSVVDTLTQNLFQHLPRVKPGYNPPFNQITSLWLKDINLTLSKHTWFTYLDLKCLELVSVEYCEGADLFVLQLANCFPKLRSFNLVHRLNNQSDRTIHAIEQLLQYLPVTAKLRDLKLCLRNARKIPDALPIVKHRDTLERLQIDVAEKSVAVNMDAVPAPAGGRPATTPPRQYGLAHIIYQPKDFNLLIKSCYRLRELSIAFPLYNLDFTCLGHGPEENSNFYMYLKIIIKNLELCTLNIVNWPQNYEWLKSKGYYKAKNASLARLAAAMFRRHRTYVPETEDFDSPTDYSSLDIVSFGVDERISICMTAPRPAHFLQSTIDVGEGYKGFSAEQVSEFELSERALDIGIFNYDARDFEKESRQHSASCCDEEDPDASDSEGSLT